MNDISDGWDGADVDVAICGGGLAGLTLARQLQREHAGLRIAVLDRLARPLPEAAFKVGESTTELAANYFGEVLGLQDYFATRQFNKMGMRFYFDGNRKSPSFEGRPEFGLTQFPDVGSFQIDRGRFENDLREMVEQAGGRLIEGVTIEDIALSEDGAPHAVTYDRRDGTGPQTITAAWVIDAMGRRRVLQRKMDLMVKRGQKHSSVWFRVPGRVDMDDAVSAGNAAWHDRVADRNRYFATNHLVDAGYWVWIIPLASAYTSIGIVISEDMHDFEAIKDRARARSWIEAHEPHLGELIRDLEMTDFLAQRDYTYTSRKVISKDRWACVGEAGMFADPLYSPGSDLIGVGNSVTSWLIGQDRKAELTSEIAENRNRFLIALNDGYTLNIQGNYPVLGCAAASACKLVWDFSVAWSFNAPMMFNMIFRDLELEALLRQATRRFSELSLRVQQLCRDWAAQSQGRVGFDFIDYLTLSELHDLRLRNLRGGKSPDQLVADCEENMRFLEELARAIFELAVQDVCPGHADRIRDRAINVRRISLDPDTWDDGGLFEPTSAPAAPIGIGASLAAAFQIRPDAMSPKAPTEPGGKAAVGF